MDRRARPGDVAGARERLAEDQPVSPVYERPVYAYRRAADQDAAQPTHHPVVIVGAGPVGLTAAIDCAVHGLPNVLLDAEDTVCDGSKAICFAKRTLEIFDRLGCGERLMKKGVVWNLGRVFFRERQIYEFNLAPEAGNGRPAFINLQQYYLEQYLIERLGELDATVLRWRNTVTAVEPRADGVGLTVETPDGPYRIFCDYLIVADGACSSIRHLLGLSCQGQVFQDRFLIVDVVMQADLPTERWFWFKPPFHAGQSALLHRQADNVWRIDFQLGCDADPDEEKQPERVSARIKAMLGERTCFELKWVSVYTFQCRRLERFQHGRVLFVGDAAHQVSPFGARGGNGGIQDVDNLIWKLALVLAGTAPSVLLKSYDAERIPAADENILNSTRSTDFITPKSEVSRAFRDATLMLAEHYPFARRLVNSGRLSVPAVLHGSPLITPDADRFDSALCPGAPCGDAPIQTAAGEDWLLRQLGNGFTGLYFTGAHGKMPARVGRVIEQLAAGTIPVEVLVVGGRLTGDAPGRGIIDVGGLVQRCYGGSPGTFYLIRPDQHVCARWRRLELEPVRRALGRALGRVAL
ncbi:MAG: FAD-dependent oxidoreductase, partial [Nitrococcus sp.]|nr:FAD-dependent oxidoreductase [Nitrococcus sp.]